MINNVTSQYSMQTYSPNQLIKDQQPQLQAAAEPQATPAQVVTEQPKQSSVPPLYKYIEGNQKINLLCSALGGIFFGLQDAKHDIQREIALKQSVNLESLGKCVSNPEKILIKESKLKGLSDEVMKFPSELKCKDLFSAQLISDTILKVAKKTLMIAGLLYAGDFLCQKFFKNNKEYEEYYQDSLKNQ